MKSHRQEEDKESDDNKKGFLQHEDGRELVVESEVLDVTFHQIPLGDRNYWTTNSVQVRVLDSVWKPLHGVWCPGGNILF